MNGYVCRSNTLTLGVLSNLTV